MAATLTMAFLGVALGAPAPTRVAVTPQPRPPALAAQRTVASRPVRASPATTAWVKAEEPGRSYAPIADEPELGPAPEFPVATSAGAPATELDAGVGATESRRGPAARRPPDRATGVPLLAVRRGSGRIVFHAIEQAGAAGDGLEGEWAVAGRCGERLRLDLAQPARGAGAPRGVGAELSSSGSWQAAVAVPVKECTTGRVLVPRRPTRFDRERFAGFATDDLQQVVATESVAWLVFTAPGRCRAVVVVRRDGAWQEAWSRESEGVQEISAVLRGGEGWDGLFVTFGGDRPDTVQRVRVIGGSAHPDAPASLRG
ncbi:MAG TPA: hypothetical protein VF613_17405 [Longimicrobium sp.]